jgi:hypothetical protein
MALTFQKGRLIASKTIQINDRQMNDRNIRVGNHQKNSLSFSHSTSAHSTLLLYGRSPRNTQKGAKSFCRVFHWFSGFKINPK